MMCSTWKISVFGILALILAFGLVTTDALAQDPPNVTVEITSDPAALRAASEATLTIGVTVTPHGTADDQKAGVIRIIIPGDWSSPLETVGAVDAVREVSITNLTGTGDAAGTGSISGRHLVVNVGKAATGEVEFVFRTATPPTMRTHGFEIRSTNHAIVDTETDAISKRGGRYYYDLEVGPIVSGTPGDAFTLTGGNNLHRQPSNDDDPPHEGKFLVYSEAPLGNVAINYNVPGTMPKGSQFIVTITSAGNAWDITRDDNTQASVSSTMDVARTGTTVTGTLKGTVQKGARLTINLKHLKAPKVGDQPATAINTGYTIQAQTNVVTDSTTDPITLEGAAPADPQFDFVTTRADGTGRLRVHHSAPDATADDNVLTHFAAGADLGQITIRLDTLTGNAGGSKYEITLPTMAGWPEPFKPIGTSTANGALSGDLSGDIPKAGTDNNDVIAATDVVGISYQVDKAPTTQGPHVFNAKTSAGPHGSLAALGGHTVHITAPHGSGTIDLIDKSGNPFVRATDAAEVGNLRFRYKPAGYMPTDAAIRITLPTGWTQARTDNPADGSDDPGEIAASPKAMVNVAADNASFTVTATEAWNSTDTIVITYRSVKVADIADGTTQSSTFSTESKSFGADTNFGALAASPIVGIGRDPDGSGSISLSTTETDTATEIGTLMITYTAAGKMEIGSIVEITVPDTGNWPDPTNSANFVLSDTARAAQSATATTMSATTSTELGSGDQIVFVYRNIGAQPAGTHTFSATSTVTYDGTPTPLGTGPADLTVTPVVPGSIALTYMKDEMAHPLTSAAPGADLGQLTFTFTAEAAMTAGSQVQVSVPAAWYPPFRGNNAADMRRGAVWVTGASTVNIDPGPEAAGPWTITATPDGGLVVDDTLVFTYNAGSAPTEDVYTFVTMASVSSGGPLVSIASSPRVTIREPITGLAVVAEPDSVFVNDDITVTVTLWDADGEGRALGDMVIMLSDGDAGGSFTDADGNAITSVTIENLGFSASATYSNGMANPMVTLTATSGELTQSDVVEIKSTISNLMVGGMMDPDPVRGDDIITVTADGRAGTDVRATVVVTKSEVDADGNEVVSSVVPTKSLDIVPAAPDAPETDDVSYTRDVDLGGLDDGDYMVTVNIGDDSESVAIEVVNDRTPPMLSEASAWPSVVKDGDQVALRVVVTSVNEIVSVTADVSGLDSTKMDALMLSEQPDEAGVYTRLFTIASEGNTNDDGEITVTFKATDRIGNASADDATSMATITLENDPSELTDAEVTPGSGKPGETIWIKATGSAGGDAMATVNNAETGMMIAQVTLDEDAANAGMYSAGLMIVEDAHPAGMYDVTVTLGTKEKTLEGALTIEPPGYDFTLSIGAGTHLIHVPLDVTQVNGADMAINTVRDLYDALGDAVSIIISLGADGSWNSYLGDDAPGMAYGDMMLGDSTGLVAVMNSAVTLELTGNALGTGGVSTIMLNAGNNLVGVPLDSAQIGMISDVLGALVSAVVVSNEAGDGFQTITQAGDPGDGPLMGGEGYIVVAAAAASIPVIGSPWQNMDDGASTAPPIASGANVKTPVLHVRGQLVDEAGMMTLDGLTVSVRNVTSGSVLGSSVATDEYSMTFVKLNSSAAKVGDILEIKADSGNPLLGIRPVQHVVTAEDVLNGSISLPDLVTYEIPAQSELLANYPNPFNPETWIPFRLAEDSNVSLDIYGASGTLVRNIDLGFTPAAVYEGRSDAIYWDGRNNFGEQVSSGLYFYHLRAGEFSATRRMVVVK